MHPQEATSKKASKYTSVMIVLMIVSLVSKVCGFVRDIVLSNVYGAGAVSDAYLTTLSIPDMVFDLLTHAVMMGFVPLAIEKLNESRDELNRFSTSAFKCLFMVALFFSAFLAMFSDVIVHVLAPGFEGESRRLAISFLRIISVTLLFRSITSVFQSYLHVSKCFVPGAFLGITLDLSVILAIVISKRYDLIYLLPCGALFGAMAQTLLLFPFSIKNGLRLKAGTHLFSKEIKGLLILSIPAVFASGLLHISNLFHRALASGMTEGGITMLSNATKVSYSIENIIVASIATVLYPLFVEYHLKGQMDMIRNAISDAINKLITFLLPASVGLAVLAEPIIDILFGRGEFTDANVRTTAFLMTLSVFGMLGLAVQALLTRALFAMKMIKLSVATSISLLVVYLGSSYVFSYFWGLHGLAFAIGFSYMAGGVLYYVLLNRVCGGINAKSTGLTLLKAAVASIVMAVGVLLVMKFAPFSQTVKLVFSVGIGVILYFLLAQVVGLKHVSLQGVFKRLKRK